MTFPECVYQISKKAQDLSIDVALGTAAGLINQYFAHPIGVVEWTEVVCGADPLSWLKENVFDKDPGEGVGADDPRKLRCDAGILGNRIMVPYAVSQAYVMRSIAESLDLPTRIAHGLSRKYSSAECESGVQGTIERDATLPDYEELFQGNTVWIAVAYKHDILSGDGDTFTTSICVRRCALCGAMVSLRDTRMCVCGATRFCDNDFTALSS